MIIEKIKSIFNKVSPIDEASIEKDIEYKEQNEFFKLGKDLDYVMSNVFLIPGQTNVPPLWESHIYKCISMNHVEHALSHLEYMKIYCGGLQINFQPLEQYIRSTKEYKEYILQKKLDDIKKDFV
jgi:hypothetical protein